MDIVKSYGNVIKKNIDVPDRALKLIKFGLNMERERVNHFPDKNIPKSLQYLNQICLDYILEPLKNSDNYAFVNLFAPCEILHAAGIHPMLVEAFSSFLSGLKCEDSFIDYAQSKGISETLCSYHKAFLGAAESGVLRRPKFAMTSSMICDANINTFRFAADKYKVPCFSIDVPYEYSKEAQMYVTKQLKELCSFIENITGSKFDEEKLKDIIRTENETKKYMNIYIEKLKDRYFPSTLTLQMYMLFTSHTFMGRNETLKFYKMLADDIESFGKSSCKRIFWVHLLPFYHTALKEYFNLSKKYQILGYDLHFDNLECIDPEHPFEALAQKMLQNKLNGTFERKISLITELVDKLNPDAVINFSHWGCRQSSGGVMILKKEMQKRNIPFLSIDGDGVDRRNSGNEQIRTRIEAFLEMIDKKSR